jgi:hypothetical protein
MRKILAAAALLTLALLPQSAMANGAPAKSEAASHVQTAHKHRHCRCHAHKRHHHHKVARRPVHHIYYHAVPRPTFIAHRYYAIPHYFYRPYYHSAWAHPYSGVHSLYHYRWYRHHRHHYHW